MLRNANRSAAPIPTHTQDLKWIEANPGKPTQDLQVAAERLMARILTFPLPTVAAINGHFTAAGAMLGLRFEMPPSPHRSPLVCGDLIGVAVAVCCGDSAVSTSA